MTNAAIPARERRHVPRVVILTTVSICTMLYALTLTIVNVVLPQLQGALSATPDQVSWVITLNVIATAVITPATGWMVARWGERQVMIWSIVGFTVCSLLCASANSLAPLLLYRIGQGIFGAPLVPLAQAIIVATYPPGQRAAAQGVFGMAVVIGPAVAPALGGYLAEEYNWRWVFLLILPLCVIALLGVIAFIRDTPRNATTPRLDWTGFIMFSVALTSAQLIMDRGERLGWLDSTEMWIYLALLGGALWVFLVHSASHDKPFINPHLFRDRNFVIGLLLVTVYGMLNITPTVLFPPMLQNLMGYPDSVIGYLLAARGAGMVFGFLIAALMGRVDPRIGMIIGLFLIGLSGWNMSEFNLDVGPVPVAINGFIQGIGSGMMWVPLSVVAFATLDARLLPDASSIFHLLRNFGSSAFISISVFAVLRSGKISYAELTEHITPYSEILNSPALTGIWSFESLAGLTAVSREIARQSLMVGYSNAFALYALVAFCSLPLLLAVKIRRS